MRLIDADYLMERLTWCVETHKIDNETYINYNQCLDEIIKSIANCSGSADSVYSPEELTTIKLAKKVHEVTEEIKKGCDGVQASWQSDTEDILFTISAVKNPRSFDNPNGRILY